MDQSSSSAAWLPESVQTRRRAVAPAGKEAKPSSSWEGDRDVCARRSFVPRFESLGVRTRYTVLCDIKVAKRSAHLNVESNVLWPLRLHGLGGGSVEPLNHDRWARWARIGAQRLGSVPVTRRECVWSARAFEREVLVEHFWVVDPGQRSEYRYCTVFEVSQPDQRPMWWRRCPHLSTTSGVESRNFYTEDNPSHQPLRVGLNGSSPRA